MFKIVSPTKTLVKFIMLLKLNLTEPQTRHLRNFMDALLACEGTKTLAKLNRLILEPTDQSAFTDFFTYSPWALLGFRRDVQKALVEWVLQENNLSCLKAPIFISIDDSKSLKPKTSLHFEVTDWFYNSDEKRGYYYGTSFVTAHFACKNRAVPLALRLYLRQKTVRRINRYRKGDNRIPFKSKYTLAKEILNELAPLLPEDVPVYVLFDSWYASKKLIKLCRRKDWHVICALRNNRKFTKKGKNKAQKLSKTARYIRKKDFKPITVKSSDSSVCYWVNAQRGFLNGFHDEVSIFISKRNPKDRKPEFFMTTDLSLSPTFGLSHYSGRWDLEVDHLYLKVRLGLGDFRLRSYEGISRYFELVGLTLAYLYWRRIEVQATNVKTLSDVIALHRKDQMTTSLRAFGEQVLKYGSVELALNEWIAKAA